MANCVPYFTSNPGDVVSILANVPISDNIANSLDTDAYKFNTTQFETVVFSVQISPQTPFPIDVELSIYSFDGVTYTALGTAFLTEFNNNFTFDVAIGDYYFCITSTFNINYTITVLYTQSNLTLIPLGTAEHGVSATMAFAEILEDCDSEVGYQIISGTLPEGLIMGGVAGLIDGQPGEQDCEAPLSDPPSYNWSDSQNQSFGLISDLVIRAFLIDSPDIFTDKSFQIEVRNNWDKEKDILLAKLDGLQVLPERVLVDDTEVVEVFEPIPAREPVTSDCEVCEIQDDGTPKQPIITETIPEVCPPKQKERISSDELKELLKDVLILGEFSEKVQVTDGVCQICPDAVPDITATDDFTDLPANACPPCETDIEEATELTIKTFDSDLCDGVDDSLPVVDIISQPVEEPDTEVLPKLVPIDGLADLLDEFKNEKSCDMP